MKKSFTAKTKLFMTIILALTIAFSLVTSVACKKNNSGTSDSSTTTNTIVARTDTQLLKNGDFEYGTANTKLTEYPIYSSINWTKANDYANGTNATSSSYSSGIIDTREYKYAYDDDGYVELDENGQPVFELDDDQKILAYQDILKNKHSQFETFKIYEYEDDGVTIKKDENDKEIYSFYNPHSPSYYGLTEYVREDGKLSDGGKVLMLNNHTTGDKGAAQHFTSTSEIKLAPNENGVFDIWVLTTLDPVADETAVKDVSPAKGIDDETQIGAYIQLTTTVGSITTPATRIKNIRTNGEWVKFSVYVKGSSFAETKISVRLGLGLGGRNDYKETVEGYAFFDDAAFTVLEKTDALPSSYDMGNIELFGANAVLDGTTLKYNGASDFINNDFSGYTSQIVANPKDATDNKDYKYLYSDNFTVANSKTFTLGIDCSKNEPALAISGNGSQEDNLINPGAIDQSLFDRTTLPAINSDGDLIFDYSNKYANVSFTTNDITIPGIVGSGDPTELQYLKISFWVKTELVTNRNGLTVKLIDKGTNGTATPAEVTLKINGSETGNYITQKGINADNDDFIKVTVIVSNTYRQNPSADILDRTFALKFTLGPTTPIDTNDIFAFPKGKVTVKDFTAINLSKAEVDSIEKETDKSVTERMLQADRANVNTTTDTTDTYSFTHGGVVENIENGIVSGILNYTGVPGNHNRVGGYPVSTEDSKDETKYVQTGTVNGLFNTEFMDNYDDATYFNGYKTEITNWLKSVATTNKYHQPLMINNTAPGLSYGYIGEKLAIATNATCVVTLKVKIFGDAKAYIYLTDANDNKEFSILGVEATNADASLSAPQQINEDYCIVLTKDMINGVTAGVDYAEVKFVIKTGSERAINFKLELWNGPRQFKYTDDSTENDNGAGIVLFDSFSHSTSEIYEDTLIKLESKYDGELENVADAYSFATADASKKIFTRLPSIVYTDANPNGEERKYLETDLENTKTAFMTNGFFIVSDLTSIDAPTEIDEITKDDTSTEDTGSTESGNNSANWLGITSLIVAIALIVALIAVGVKKLMDYFKKKKASSHSYYDKDARDTALKNIAKNKEKKETKFKEEYDYDNIESNIIEDEEEELEVIEETEEADLEEGTVETAENDEPQDDADTSDDDPKAE